MFCGQCGEEVTEHMENCSRCGVQLLRQEVDLAIRPPNMTDPVAEIKSSGHRIKYCKRCGSMIDERAVICPECGMAQERIRAASDDDTGCFGWGILGFCIPLVGLILYLVWKTDKPKTASMAGMGALISVILEVLIYVVAGILGFSLFATLM